ncbi:transcriptional repressor [Cyanobacterium stanieri LEGE 03274]|uniref:Transcriptional repressor n=1 Tax=Cyanobacterium stanieri LEGE 03274 TaxID=1828756 RepID=A0ABR9V1I1_9CHRO|nr:Fur family transcriptional regulator [Cyanobacterium stanieri]MBE9221401.1 transcriptional repressor [Cyanobacterium stanieri LEGE 03274]
MGKKADEIISVLKAKGLRVTPQRYAVYANLLSRNDHPTAENILTDLNKDVPTLSQATIYLSLQTLRDVGLIREVLLQEGVCRYDANVSPHHHFRCNCCGKIEDIPWETFSNLSIHKLRRGLKVDHYEVIVQGECNSCAED